MRKLPRSHFIKINEEYMAGRSVEDIAKSNGIKPYTAYQYLSRAGVLEKRRQVWRARDANIAKEMYADPANTIVVIARHLNKSVCYVRELLLSEKVKIIDKRSLLRRPSRRPNGKPYRILQVVSALINTKENCSKIAKRLNVSREYVYLTMAGCRDAGIQVEEVGRAA